MGQEKFVSITISLPKVFRDQLRKMAAKASLKSPDEVMSVSQLGRKIICQYLENLSMENKVKIDGGVKNE